MDIDEETVTPEQAFWLLSDEIRVVILHALWESSDNPVPFSDLRTQAGNPDSGQFNYHLGKLRDHFVSKSDDGYTLTQAGREVVRAVLAGVLTDRPQVEPARIDGHCVECDRSLVVRYDEYGIVECSECGETAMWNEFPPAGLAGRTPTEIAATFDEWTRSRFHLAMDGICPNCAGQMTTEIIGATEGEISTTHCCENCKYEARAPLFGHVIRHPAVVSFHYERGIDITALPYWELQSLARDQYDETVLADDPWTARITIESDDDCLRLTLNHQLDVTDVDRSLQ